MLPVPTAGETRRTSQPPPQRPTVGIVGSAGAYGRWLQRFFAMRMGLPTLGHDPCDSGSDSPERLLAEADVLLFSVPIAATVATIDDWRTRAAGREAGRLWLDVTSIKQGPVAAMLRSEADVAGLHPMTAPPPASSLKGRVMAVCEARLDRWRPWFEALLGALQAECVRIEPEAHDRAMALVQAMVHAGHLAQAGTLATCADASGGLDALLAVRTASFELDHAMAARILSLNPRIYEDIQFGNPHVPEVLDTLSAELAALRALVARGDASAREEFRTRFLDRNREAFGAPSLAAGNATFERVGHLLADLLDRPALSVHLPEDRAGSLRALLAVFERHGISLASLHSLRTPAGEVHFRFGFDPAQRREALDAAAAEIDASGIGRVLADAAGG